MKAAVNKSYGPPSNIKILDIPKPEPKANEILIKVSYSSVNRTDCGFLRAKPFVTRFFTGLLKPKYESLGCEFSGTVESIGKKVTAFKVGDKVFGFDDAKFGAHKEYKTIAENKMVHKVPKNIDLKTAAISTEGAHYALFYIYKISEIKNRQVFVHGGTGAIGSAAIQILKSYGAYITASSPSKNIKTVKKLGADEVFNWQQNDIASQQQTYDFFFDSVGKSSFAEARKILKPGGVYASSELGKYGQNLLLALINPLQRLFTKRNIYFPVPTTRKKELVEIARLLEEKSFNPLVDKEFELENIVQAYEYVETGQKLGNVVVKI